MARLKFSGDFYQGDGIIVRAGDEVTVSQQKAGQLLSDFPGDWTPVRDGTRSIGNRIEYLKNKAQKPSRDKTGAHAARDCGM